MIRDEAEIRDELARLERIQDRIDEILKTGRIELIAGLRVARCMEGMGLVEGLLRWVLGDDERKVAAMIDEFGRMVEEAAA